MLIEKTASQMLQDMLARLPDDYEKDPGSLFCDNMAPIAIEMEVLNKKLGYILKQSFAETAEGIFLDYRCGEVGIDRRPANKAVGFVTIKGNAGTVIEKGVQVSSDSFIFETSEKATVGSSGEVVVPIIASEGGKAYNLPPGAINTFPVTIQGLQEVTNKEATSDGYDAESDDELRERYFFKVRNPITSGNVYHYKKWCKEVEGVGGVKVYPLWAGAGTVKCVITDKRIEEAPAELVKRVAEYLETVRPIGATVTVTSADGMGINITATVILSENVDLNVVKNLFSIEAEKYLKEVGFVNNYVSYARVGKILLSVPGVLDYNSLQLNGRMGNVMIADNEVPALGTINLTKGKV